MPTDRRSHRPVRWWHEPRRFRALQGGFTLVELMIVMVIVAILAAVAYPSYMDQVRKTRRTDATTALMKTAQALQRCYTEFHKYNDTRCPAVNSGNAAALSSDFSGTEDGYYTLSALVLNANAFSLQAAPTGPQSSDDCGSFTLDHIGRKGVTGDMDGNGTAGDVNDVKRCW